MTNIAHNLYIHVPFCISKCKYCAFFSHACANPDWETYTASICDEIQQWAQKLGNICVPTIFFGGGTPSLIPIKHFEQIMQTIHNCFKLTPDTEITLESNPGTLDAKKLTLFKTAGISRLSIGVQSLDDEKLKFLGRRHNVMDAIKLIDAAHSLKLRTSADFIYGLPGDTKKTVIQTCKQINNIGLLHVSMYELTIEANTPFGKMNLDMPTNEAMADMYMAIEDNLNLPRYEISNYACHGQECRHNQNVWDGAPYIGIGQGAAGRVFINNTWFEQLGNNKKFETISDNARATEMILTGMRTVRGCQLTDTIKNVIDIEWIMNNPEYVNIQNNRLCATPQGMMILDDIILNVIR